MAVSGNLSMTNPNQNWLTGGTTTAMGAYAQPGTAAAATAGGAPKAPPDWSGSNQYMGNVQGYMGQGTAHVDATGNPLAQQNNPYLQQMIDSAGKDSRAYYDQFIAPKFSSGSSFGNTGLGHLEVFERDKQADNFQSQVNSLRFDDYKQRADLMEKGANRQDTLNSGQRDNNLTAGSTYGQLAQNAGQFNYAADFTQFQDQNSQADKRIDALLRGMATNNTTPQGTPAVQGNPWAGALAGATAGVNLYNQWNTPTKK